MLVGVEPPLHVSVPFNYYWVTVISSCRSVTGNSIVDHLEYYGVKLGGETWGSCKIVMDPRLAQQFGSEDLGGNFVLTKKSASPLLEPHTEIWSSSI